MNFAELLPACLEAVSKAGVIIKESWQRPSEVTHKGRIDLVTDTDKAVEEFLVKALAQIIPKAAFVGEESANSFADLGSYEYCWVVDPVDGTTNFVHRIPIVGISVALCQKGEPVLGIIDAPMLSERYWAIKGGPAFLNNNPIKVSTAATLSDCLVATGFPYEVRPQMDQIISRLKAVLPETQGLRRPGAASIDLAWVASGRLDAFYENGLKPWDMAAGWLIVCQAGGKVTTFEGEAVAWGKSLLATNGRVHADFVRLLKN